MPKSGLWMLNFFSDIIFLSSISCFSFKSKIYTTKKQQQEQTRSKTLNPEKISELNEQIKDYERKNKAYKRKIENIFD